MPSANVTSYSVVDLLSWQESGALQISPKFQRRSVWGTPAKGHLVDSILLDYPIPPIHIRLVPDKAGGAVREVIDGQQRIRAIFDFIAGSYRIPPSVSEAWGGKSYEKLTDDEQETIRLFSFTVYQYKSLTDREVLDIFARLNTYSVSLSAQELRNGQWFGEFKRVSYRLATDALRFWRNHKIFTERQIARMRESELTSELLIAALDGIQDKKGTMGSFYEHLDSGWGATAVQWQTGKSGTQRSIPSHYLSAEDAARQFEATMAAIDDTLGSTLKDSPLRRPALFYTLFCITYHMLYGLPRQDEAPMRQSGISQSTKTALRQSAAELTDWFERKSRTGDDVLLRFSEASARQTDNIGPRQDRFVALLELVSRNLNS